MHPGVTVLFITIFILHSYLFHINLNLVTYLKEEKVFVFNIG